VRSCEAPLGRFLGDLIYAIRETRERRPELVGSVSCVRSPLAEGTGGTGEAIDHALRGGRLLKLVDVGPLALANEAMEVQRHRACPLQGEHG
jgi:hypothetical protein